MRINRQAVQEGSEYIGKIPNTFDNGKPSCDRYIETKKITNNIE